MGLKELTYNKSWTNSNIVQKFSQQSEKTGLIKVIRIVDGDTIVVNLNSKEEKVRLIGVDTPETVKPGTPVQKYGKEASNFTKNMLIDKKVKLEFDVQHRDKYARLLAYVYLEDGRMFNKILIEQGYAQVMTVPPNVKYQQAFIKLQRKAKENKKGLWKD
ncbi:MAG: thermonuclease family protein [Deltaproteobacteria bacterium]